MKTIEEIREYCRGEYYVNDINGNEVRWTRFKNHTEKQIKEYIEDDTKSLCNFIGIKYTKLFIKKYKVCYKKIIYRHLEIEANNYVDAQLKAQETNIENNVWFLDKVEEIEKKK